MKAKVLLVLLAMVLAVSAAALAACRAPVEEAPLAEEVWEWPETLIFMSMSPASNDYAAAVGWTTPLAQDTGMKIRIMCEDSLALGARWLKQGLFFSSGLESAEFALEAHPNWATRDGGPFQARIWYPRYVTDTGFLVWGDSDINTPYDIKPGTKIQHKTFTPLGRIIMDALLAWGQVDPDDVEWVPVGSIQAGTQQIIDGRADIGFGFPASPGFYEVEAGPHGQKWIELNAEEDPEGAKRFMEVINLGGFGPMESAGIVPSARGVWSLNLRNGYSCRADADPELVYRLVKWLDENYDRYKDANPWCTIMTMDNLLRLAETDFIPLHDGAVKYLEEKGLWTAAHEARRQANIDLITEWEKAYSTAIAMADEKGLEVDTENEEWIELWENYKKELGLPRIQRFAGLH